MPITPAMASLMRKQAAQAAEQAQSTGATTGSAYELMQAQLYEHTRALKAIQSVERKVDAKRGFLADYWPWVDGVLAAGQGGEDMVLSTVFVWAIDAGEYDRALDMGAYILAHGLPLPDRYKRDAATTLIDEFADASLKPGGQQNGPGAQHLVRVAELTAAHDVPDQVRAKLYKALGYAVAGRKDANDKFEQLGKTDTTQALALLQRALELDKASGVKKDIERLERRLAAITAPDAGT
jgi:hypothetical protein